MKNGPPVDIQAAPPPGEGGRRGWRAFLGACRAHRLRAGLGGLVLALALFIPGVDRILAGPMRSWAERTMNAQLKGYTVRIARVRPHLWRLAFDLEGVAVAQDTHPDPPVADFGALRFSLLLRELIRFKAGGNLVILRPALHIDLAQVQEEARSRVSLQERGWQRAVESIFPIKLDRVEIREGSLLYRTADTAARPLQLTRVAMVAQNIRNIAAAPGTYPSPVVLEGLLFDTGRVRFAGAADFLREPYAAARGELHLERVPLDRLDPLAQAYQLKTTGGFLSVDGAVESTPERQTAHLTQVLLEDLRVDYVHSPATVALEKAHGEQAIKLARRLRNAPQFNLRLDTLRLTGSQIGFVDAGARPSYRVFMDKVDLKLENLNNQAGHGKSPFQTRGVFMGSGTTVASGTFQAGAEPADFEVRLQLDGARLASLNALLLAHAGVDVAEGRLSLYTELKVKDGRVDGYLKPLVRDLRVYDRNKDGGKPFGKRVEMHVLQALGQLFKNRSSGEVATVARISGSTRDPRASEWQVLRKLLGNGLAHAILPGFLEKPKPSDKSPGKS